MILNIDNINNINMILNCRTVVGINSVQMIRSFALFAHRVQRIGVPRISCYVNQSIPFQRPHRRIAPCADAFYYLCGMAVVVGTRAGGLL